MEMSLLRYTSIAFVLAFRTQKCVEMVWKLSTLLVVLSNREAIGLVLVMSCIKVQYMHVVISKYGFVYII